MTLLSLTDAAAERARQLLDGAKPDAGLRVGVKSAGCSGFKYTIELADTPGALDDVIEAKGVRLFVDPTATMFLLGAEMDFTRDKLQSGFVFSNPNESARCGCGESVAFG